MPARLPISTAAAIAAPEEMPTGRPSVSAARRAQAKAVSLPMRTTSSMSEVSSVSGMKPAPMPWILCGPGVPPESTGLSSGSTATTRRCGRRGFRTLATPVSVPPVPTPEMKTSSRPSVSRQISSAVVRRWISGLAGFLNCCGITASPISATSSSARAMAPPMPRDAGVSSRRAPRRRSILRRSTDMLSGMVRIRR